MFATLDVDSLHICLQYCDLKTQYLLGCCNTYLCMVVRSFLVYVRNVGDWCRAENVPMILRDMPLVALPVLVPARESGRRVDEKTFRLLECSDNLESICHIGIDTMTPKGLKHVLELPSVDHQVLIDMSPRWRTYLQTKIQCNVAVLRLTVIDFQPARIIRWLNLPTHTTLKRLDLCCDVCDMNSVVSLLPETLQKLLIQGRRRTSDSVGFLSDILQRFTLLDELRVVHCIKPSDYNCNFIIDMFLSESFRIPRVVGIDPFPVHAYHAALNRGCFICICSSNFSDPYTAVEHIESMNRAIYCSECQDAVMST